MIAGEWIEIRYKRPNGTMGSKWVQVDSQGRYFWKPTEPISGVYFRTSRRDLDDFNVVIEGLPRWSPLWTPDEIADFVPVDVQPGGVIQGFLYESANLRLPAVNGFKLLEPIPFELKPIEIDEEEEEKKSKAVLEKIKKNLAKQEAAKAAPVRHGLLWRLRHRRKKAEF